MCCGHCALCLVAGHTGKVALSENQRAVTLLVREPSWMSCELGTTIYVADFGQLSLKPELLRTRLAHPGFL